MNQTLPILLLVSCLSFAVVAAEAKAGRQSAVHLKFDGDASEPEWSSQNDDVMGGISKGGAEIKEGLLHFSGSLSLENNGGFAQVRIVGLGYDLSGKTNMKLRVMGDGRTYELRLATNARHRGSRIAYSVPFTTKAGEWSEVAVAFADLKPSHHGEPLQGPPADLSQVEEMSLLIGDKREGPFSLKVDWMRAE
jgi:NADH dehydrogenase [ubiquinone] 1 alpha subcomplex assembly factor 1